MASTNYKIFIGQDRFNPEGYTACYMGGQIFNMVNAGIDVPDLADYLEVIDYGRVDNDAYSLYITFKRKQALSSPVEVYLTGFCWDSSTSEHEVDYYASIPGGSVNTTYTIEYYCRDFPIHEFDVDVDCSLTGYTDYSTNCYWMEED